MTDIQLTITPDAMKAAARALRALIRAKTGQDIAHSSVLNTLAQGLGLGANFGAMLAAHTPAPALPHTSTTVLLSFDLSEEEMEMDEEVDGALERLVRDLTQDPAWDPAWTVHDHYTIGAGGTAALWVSRTGILDLSDAHTTGFLGAFAGGALALLAPFAARKGAFACAFPSGGDVRSLSVDFQYRNTGQICTTSVQENVWNAVHAAGVDTQDALPVVGYDCDIADEAIQVLDTRVDFGTIWNG